MSVLDVLVGPITSIIDKVIPDKEARAKAKLALAALPGVETVRVALTAEGRHRDEVRRLVERPERPVGRQDPRPRLAPQAAEHADRHRVEPGDVDEVDRNALAQFRASLK